MNFLRRKVQGTETVREEEGRIIHREIEITVEREWISMQTPDDRLPAAMDHATEQSPAEMPMQLLLKQEPQRPIELQQIHPEEI